MKCQSLQWLLTLAVCASIATLTQAQQQPRSEPPAQGTQSSDPRHILLPGGLDRGDAKDLLARKLRRSQDLQQTKDVVSDVIKNPERYGMTDQDLQNWIKEYSKNNPKVDPDKVDPKLFDPGKVDPSDPKVKDLIDKIKNDESMSQEQKDSLKRMAEEWKHRQPTTPNPMVEPNPMVNPPHDPAITPPVGPPPTFPRTSELPPPPAHKPAERPNWFTRKTKELMPKGDSNAKKSDSNNEWVKKTREFSNNNLPKFDSKKANNNTPNLSDKPRVKSPSVPNVNMPSTGGGGGGGGVGSATSGMGTFLMGLLAVVALAVVAFIVFRILQNRKPGDVDALAAQTAKPVDPSQIRTRADLVRAFEYLALKLLGFSITNDHHLEIGQQLGATPTETPEHREAAGELTHLYEQARYTPPEEELSADELRAARRDLELLGGAAVS